MPEHTHATPTSVYRYYDAGQNLIYVGITSRGAVRNREHYTGKAWWPLVHSQRVDHYTSRAEALAHEAALIRQHRPPFNTQHNPDPQESLAAYQQRIAAHRYTHQEVFKRAHLIVERQHRVIPLREVDGTLVTLPAYLDIAARLGPPPKGTAPIFWHGPALPGAGEIRVVGKAKIEASDRAATITPTTLRDGAQLDANPAIELLMITVKGGNHRYQVARVHLALPYSVHTEPDPAGVFRMPPNVREPGAPMG